jgi:Glycosyl transferase family 11
LLRRAPSGIRYVQEKHFHFDPRILSLHDGVCLHGYWQSEKYFSDVADIIRREFQVKLPATGPDEKLRETVASTDSVSVHFRRGDYAANPVSNRIHGVLPLDYYRRCVQELTKTVRAPHFFVFSDEPQWVRDHLRLSYPTTIVEHQVNGSGAHADIKDLRLMSQCKHHIIANSSFSWWGAWLSPHQNKMVFAPRQWFTKEGLASARVDDLLPDGWIAL